MDACPQCTDPRRIEVEGVAQCEACGFLFESLPKVVRAPVVRLELPPNTVRLEVHGAGVELKLPWRNDLNPLFFGGRLLFGIMLMWGAVEATSLAGLALAATAGFVSLYYTACALVNRTTLLIGRRGLEVSHGPLPTFQRGGRFAAPSMGRLKITARQLPKLHRNEQPQFIHSLEAPGGCVLDSWTHRETLEYVCHAAQRVTGSPETVAP